jgi:hypothetical protein
MWPTQALGQNHYTNQKNRGQGCANQEPPPGPSLFNLADKGKGTRVIGMLKVVGQ